jgi:hypothetical protein
LKEEDFQEITPDEQREEEEKIRNILFSMDLDMPKWKIDEMFKNLI